jgi:integrase
MNYTVSVRKRSDTWSYQIFIGSKYHSSKSGFKTKAEAKRAGDSAALKIKSTDKAKGTFKEVADLYVADGYKEKSSLRTYRMWLNNLKPLHNIEMDKLTYSDVAPVINNYYLTHKLSGSQSLLRFGKSIVDYAINKLDYDIKNPFVKIKLKPKEENMKKKHTILTMDEMMELFEKIEDPDYKFLTMLFGLAGLRISEARGLAHKHFVGDEIHVRQQRQVVDNEIFVKPQLKSNNSKRNVPMHPALKAAYRKIPVNIDKDNLVIMRFVRSSDLSKMYKRIGYDITPHSLRHAYTTYCIQQGLDFKTISMIIGDSVEMVLKTYSHVNEDMYNHAKKVLTNPETKNKEAAKNADGE